MFGYLKRRYCFLLLNHIYDNQTSKIAINKKNKYLRKMGNSIGNNVRVMGPLHSYCRLTIGDNTFIGTEFRCEGRGNVYIGSNCDIAPQVTILTGTHEIGTSEKRAGKGITADVRIGNGCWVGARSIILPNINIGNGCIIGAGAVVTHDVPDNCKALGIPAKIFPIKDSKEDI
ncbi:acyltransferase [Lacrimispora sp. 210928-DFI.3.58]|uniref:acyltransferase n=1 Tax=Lacrimispora sp. 210928-DFI.3.58 TaxID=2883214 RepID=UPI001D0816B5|nr:DapH/DapD/GlmU-related protein [Lacrimispora sp. 210928-DFI.3.58]MCB7320077.1 hypothetical protein [Lacrimispora sp. 210928-DFI.3.58]